MRVYRCDKNCYGFKGRYWKEGQTVSLMDAEPTPPAHFSLVSGEVPSEPEPEPEQADPDLEEAAPEPGAKPEEAQGAPTPLARVRRKKKQ